MRKKEFVVQDSSRERGELDKREHKPLETLACPDAAGKELCFFISNGPRLMGSNGGGIRL